MPESLKHKASYTHFSLFVLTMDLDPFFVSYYKVFLIVLVLSLKY